MFSLFVFFLLTMAFIVECSGFSFNVNEVVRLEKVVLSKLEWKLTASTCLDFLLQYVKVVGDCLSPSYVMDFSTKIGVVGESDFLYAKAACHGRHSSLQYESVVDEASKTLESMVSSYSMIHYKPSILAIVALYNTSTSKKEIVLERLRKCIPRSSLEDLNKCISSNRFTHQNSV